MRSANQIIGIYETMTLHALKMYHLQEDYNATKEERERLKKNIAVGEKGFEKAGVSMDPVLDSTGKPLYRNLFQMTGDLIMLRKNAKDNLERLKKGIEEVETLLKSSEIEKSLIELESQIYKIALQESDIRLLEGKELDTKYNIIISEMDKLTNEIKKKIETDVGKSIYWKNFVLPFTQNVMEGVELLAKGKEKT